MTEPVRRPPDPLVLALAELVRNSIEVKRQRRRTLRIVDGGRRQEDKAA